MWAAMCTAARLQAEADAAAAAEKAATEEEVRRLQREKEEYEASIPEDIKNRVAEAVALQMVRVALRYGCCI